MAKLPVFDSVDAKTGNYHLHMTSKPITVRLCFTHHILARLSVSPSHVAAISNPARDETYSLMARCCSAG